MKIVEQNDSKLVLESGFGFVASTTHTFDKTAGKYFSKSKGLIGGGREAEFALSEFSSIQVEEMTQRSEDSVENRVFRLVLVKQSGERLPLTTEYTGNLKAHQKLADAIKPFVAG